jgi:hypothetical protein
MSVSKRLYVRYGLVVCPINTEEPAREKPRFSSSSLPSHPRFNGSADTVWFSSTAASIGSDGRTSRTNLTADHQPEAREETGLEVLVDHLTAFTTAREPAKGFGVVNFVFSSRSV